MRFGDEDRVMVGRQEVVHRGERVRNGLLDDLIVTMVGEPDSAEIFEVAKSWKVLKGM